MITSVNLHVSKQLAEGSVIRFFRNNVLDLIWAFALSNAIYGLNLSGGKYKIGIVISPILLGIILELLQLFRITGGTFDYFDIIAEAIGVAVAITIQKIDSIRRKKR